MDNSQPMQTRLYSRLGALFSVAVALATFLLLAFQSPSLEAAPSSNQETVNASDLILVGLMPGTNPAELSTYFAQQGFQLAEHWPAFDLAAIRPLPSAAVFSAETMVAAASTLSLVRFAEADGLVEAAVVDAADRDLSSVDTNPWVLPNDPLYENQWALPQINMETAWNITHGNPTVVVAIVDSGVEVTHEDLMLASVYPNGIELNGQPGIDDDDNGYIDDIYGWDWVDDDNDPNDLYGHGTHVAGALVAVTNNNLGVAGASPNLRIVPLRILDQRGAGFISDLVSALDYARTQGANIVNLSLVLRSDSNSVYEAIKRLYAEDVLVVAVTGNNGPRVYWPGVYTETVAVAAVNAGDAHASFSNVGPETDIAAPGDGVLSTYRDNSYREWQGTSFAAPYVAAAAGLVWSLRPDLSRDEIVDILLQTAVDVNAAEHPGFDPYLGHGRLDVGAALMRASEGVHVHLQLPAGSYLSVGQPLQIPIRVTVTDTQSGAALPVQGAVVDVAIISPKPSDAEAFTAAVIEERFYSDESGYVVGTLPLPDQPGLYTLMVTHGVHSHSLVIDVKASPLALSLTPEVTEVQVGDGAVALAVTAETQDGALFVEDLLITLQTTLGHFPDGSQSRTVMISGGVLTETLSTGTVAGIAEVELNVSGQKQQISVLFKPGVPARLEGPSLLVGRDFGSGATVEIELHVYDRYGNQVWAPYPINFYSTGGQFSPASVQALNGEATVSYTIGSWVQGPQPIWAMIPGTFAVYRVDAIRLAHHRYLPFIQSD